MKIQIIMVTNQFIGLDHSERVEQPIEVTEEIKDKFGDGYCKPGRTDCDNAEQLLFGTVLSSLMFLLLIFLMS